MTQSQEYGDGDATFRAAGGQAGIRKLIDTFFDIMGSNPAYRRIYEWHPDDIEVSRDKLALFLWSWMIFIRVSLDLRRGRTACFKLNFRALILVCINQCAEVQRLLNQNS